jgi:hypothetical protein
MEKGGDGDVAKAGFPVALGEVEVFVGSIHKKRC